MVTIKWWFDLSDVIIFNELKFFLYVVHVTQHSYLTENKDQWLDGWNLDIFIIKTNHKWQRDTL